MTDNYIPINDFAFAGHFMDKDIALAPEDLVAIKPLAKTYSVTLWKKYISEQHRHLMQIPSEQANFTVDDNTPQVSYTDYWNNSHFTPIATKFRPSSKLGSRSSNLPLLGTGTSR